MQQRNYGPVRQHDGSTRFRLWAPQAALVELLLEGDDARVMQRLSEGWHDITLPEDKTGQPYRFRLDGKELPDPASTLQPHGVEGPSVLADHGDYTWADAAWRGRPWEEAVIYELHIGTFTPEGTFAAAAGKLDHLKALGVTAIELMPVAAFGGARGWGYDGVFPYAIHPAYGTPAELKKLVDAAHAAGIMVFLDVVYNHFGPEGNRLQDYAKDFFTERFHTPWGAAIDFSRPEVRNFFIENALYWLEEFHLDGLRFDAVHAMTDPSDRHFIDELGARIRESVTGREIHLILENEKNEAHFLRRGEGDKPELFSAQWNDDIHHCFHVLLTGETNGYYANYADKPLERLGRCLTQGFDYQGPVSGYDSDRGEPSADLQPTAFVAFLQNSRPDRQPRDGRKAQHPDRRGASYARGRHSAVEPANSHALYGRGMVERNAVPLFRDFSGELADAVRDGRRDEFSSFEGFSDPAARENIPDPNAAATAAMARLDWGDLGKDHFASRLAFTRKLLVLRQEYIVPLLKIGVERAMFDLIGNNGIEVRWQFRDKTQLQLVANFSGHDMHSFHLLDHATHVWGSFHAPMPAYKCAWGIARG